jgi:molecular chaperone GrpE
MSENKIEEAIPEASGKKSAAEGHKAPVSEKAEKAAAQSASRQAAEMEKLLQEVENITSRLEENQDKYLRLAAEYDNYRKRTQKERENLYTDIRGDTILQFLPIYDNLERALKQKTNDAAFYKGIEMTMSQFTDILTKLGVSEILALNKHFDPLLHNAVMQAEDENAEQGVIVEVLQKGFMIGEKVIRFAMVKVAS